MGHITPVPYKKLLPLCIIYFIEAFVFTNIFSYVGFMVYDFHLTDDEDKVGYYAGYIGSTFSIAGFLSSFWWGRISDRYGRRPVLIFGCVGGVVSTLLFGFSTSLEMAIACRFAAGLLNGNVGVVKGYAADICDKTNQIKGVGMMQLGWGLGGILGPLFGGILSRPCDNFKNLCSKNSIFWKFPYLLPNLFSCLAGVIAVITLMIYLPKEEKKSKKIELQELNKDEFSVDESDPDLETSIVDAATLHTKLDREDSFVKDREGLLGRRPAEKSGGVLGQLSAWLHSKMNKDSIFKNKTAMLSVITYSILGGAFTMYDEAFPLFAMAQGSTGGLDATSSDIGIVGAINGVSAVAVQLVLFYPIATRLGFIRLYRLGLFMGVFLFANYPSLHFFLSNRVIMWVALAAATFVKVLVGQFSFSAVTAIISNSCPLTQVGAINGFAQSFVGLIRAFSPAVAGNLLAWGFSNSFGFPLNQYLIFILMSIFMAVSLGLSFLLPRSLDYPHEDPLLPPKGEEKEGRKESVEREGEGVVFGEDEKLSMLPTRDLQAVIVSEGNFTSSTGGNEDEEEIFSVA